MDLLTLHQPTGAATIGTAGSTQSIGAANGAGGFEQLLFGLLLPGTETPQGTPQPATGASGIATALVETGGTALTGATVLGVNGILPTTGSGENIQPKTGSQATLLPTGGNTNPVTAALTSVKSTTVQGITAAVTSKTTAPADLTPGSVPAPANKAPTTLTSVAKGLSPAGTPNQQGVTTPTAGSAVTAALNGKTAAPGESANKPASLAGGSSEVVTAKATIKAAVIDAPGAGQKSVKSGTKTAGSGAKGSKSAGSTRQTLQAQNEPTIAQAAQAATKSNAAKTQSPSGKTQAIEPFGPTPTSSIAAGGEGVTLVSVSSVTTSTGVDSLTHTAVARAATPSIPVPQQVAIQFSQALADGAGRISIQLQPESLGRVKVEIELTKDGRLSAVFIAERPETLEMLQRDSRALERALNEAGVRTDADGFSFSLRGEGRQAQQFNNLPGGSGSDGELDGIESAELLTLRAPILNANALLDIQV